MDIFSIFTFFDGFLQGFWRKMEGFSWKIPCFWRFFQDMDFQESPFFKGSGVGNTRKGWKNLTLIYIWKTWKKSVKVSFFYIGKGWWHDKNIQNQGRWKAWKNDSDWWRWKNHVQSSGFMQFIWCRCEQCSSSSEE